MREKPAAPKYQSCWRPTSVDNDGQLDQKKPGPIVQSLLTLHHGWGHPFSLSWWHIEEYFLEKWWFYWISCFLIIICDQLPVAPFVYNMWWWVLKRDSLHKTLNFSNLVKFWRMKTRLRNWVISLRVTKSRVGLIA